MVSPIATKRNDDYIKPLKIETPELLYKSGCEFQASCFNCQLPDCKKGCDKNKWLRWMEDNNVPVTGTLGRQ